MDRGRIIGFVLGIVVRGVGLTSELGIIVSVELIIILDTSTLSFFGSGSSLLSLPSLLLPFLFFIITIVTIIAAIITREIIAIIIHIFLLHLPYFLESTLEFFVLLEYISS